MVQWCSAGRWTAWQREEREVEMCLRKSRGCRCCKKVGGHLPEPEIQSVTVQTQLDGVHPKCTPHKSHSHTHKRHAGRQHTHTARVRPIHTTDGSLFSTAAPGHAGLVLPTNLQPLTLLIANPGPRLCSTNRLGTVRGRHNNIQNKAQTERKRWDRPVGLCAVNQLPPLTRWLPK